MPNPNPPEHCSRKDCNKETVRGILGNVAGLCVEDLEALRKLAATWPPALSEKEVTVRIDRFLSTSATPAPPSTAAAFERLTGGG